jgi:hypothetical protein
VKKNLSLCGGELLPVPSYYRDLHDKELLSQAESIYTELQRRRLIDVRVPCDKYLTDGTDFVRCSISSIERKDNFLSLTVERHFERPSSVGPEQPADVTVGTDKR